MGIIEGNDLDWRNGGYTASSRASAQDTYAAITREEYDNYVKNFTGLEDTLINRAANDTSLVDAAKKNAGKSSALTSGIAERNAQRYGVGLTAMQKKEQSSALLRSNTLGGADAINNARLTQKDLNSTLTAKLIDIGHGINTSVDGQLSPLAASEQQRNAAYKNARTQANATNLGTASALASLAIMAFSF